MACQAKLIANDGREFALGKFNEGKRTETQIAHAIAQKYSAMIRRMGLPGPQIRIIRKDGTHLDIPLEQVRSVL